MATQDNNAWNRFGSWVKNSLLIKLGSIGFLTLLLIIPNSMINDLVNERQGRHVEASWEVSSSWGSAQTITGPILSVPVSEWVQLENGKKQETVRTAFFLPTLLQSDGEIIPSIRKRGIYKIVVYQSELVITGKFSKPDLEALHLNPENVHWDQAKISLGISGLSGIKNRIGIEWSGQNIQLEPGTADPSVLASGVSNGVPLNPDQDEYNFSINLKVNGTGNLKFEPLGKETRLNLESTWPSPSFTGSFLPDSREVSKDGFKASWTVLDFNRNYPQQWLDHTFTFNGQNTGYEELNSYGRNSSVSASEGAAFGVRLVQPVDEYAKTERSTKYAIMVIGLTFLIYFFFETLRKFHIHPFQYLLVGLALSVFYLLLLSISEYLGFNKAYFLATGATISLIGIYSYGIIKSWRLTLQLSVLLGLIYSFIFIVLQLEDFALLAGSLGIFGALAIVMFYSRNVDWYNLNKE